MIAPMLLPTLLLLASSVQPDNLVPDEVAIPILVEELRWEGRGTFCVEIDGKSPSTKLMKAVQLDGEVVVPVSECVTGEHTFVSARLRKNGRQAMLLSLDGFRKTGDRSASVRFAFMASAKNGIAGTAIMENWAGRWRRVCWSDRVEF